MFGITRYQLGLFIGLAVLIAFPVAYSFASSPTGFEIDPEFQGYYEEAGGLPVFGYAVSGPGDENGRLVQYFERQRLELHPEYAGTPYVVLLGHLGWQDAERRGLMNHEAFQPRSSGNGEGHFFPETGHNLSGTFQDYWNDHGLDFGDQGVSFRESLALFGYPISEEFEDPESGLVTQYFERARFEHHPDNADTEYEVLLGHLGNAEVEFLRANGRGPDGNGPPGQGDSNDTDGQEEQSEPEPTATPEPEPEPTATPEPEPTATPEPEPTATPEPEPTSDEGSDNNDEVTPSMSIQQMVDNASAGDTVTVPAGIYRETVTIDKPITLVGEPGAEIRGSDVWTEWNSSGGQWVSAKSAPKFGNNHGQCAGGGDLCKQQEQVFVDGQQLERVWEIPGHGQFAVNDHRQIVLGQDPNGRMIEVSTREYWARGAANNVTVEGFTMKHAANRAQTGAVNNRGYDDWTIRNNNLSYAHGANVSVYGGTNLRLNGNDISFGGQLGVHGSEASNIVMSRNRLYENATGGYSSGWEAGAHKFAVVSNVTIDGNEIFRNNGGGLWCDIDCNDVTISNNRVYENTSGGITYEISRNARIFDNVVWENAYEHRSWGWGAGIRIQNSRDTEVFDNIVAWNGDGISVISQDRENSWSPDGRARPDWNEVVNNTVRDNNVFSVAIQSHHDFSLAWLEDWDSSLTDSSSNNKGERNSFYHHNPEDSWRVFAWGESEFAFNDLESFSATPGENNGTFISDGEKDRILNNAGVPTTPQR